MKGSVFIHLFIWVLEIEPRTLNMRCTTELFPQFWGSILNTEFEKPVFHPIKFRGKTRTGYSNLKIKIIDLQVALIP